MEPNQQQQQQQPPAPVTPPEGTPPATPPAPPKNIFAPPQQNQQPGQPANQEPGKPPATPGSDDGSFSPEERQEIERITGSSLEKFNSAIKDTQQQMSQVDSQVKQMQDLQALNDFLSSEDGAPFRDHAAALRANISGISVFQNAENPVMNFIGAVIGPSALMKIGASMQQKQQATSDSSYNGHNTVRQLEHQSALEKVNNLSDDEFRKYVNGVERGTIKPM